jgi:formylglycine-generating enzyme required for sulfatase activity
LLAGCVCAALAGAVQAERFALVIGIDRYEQLGEANFLRKSVNDATAFAEELRKPAAGFKSVRLALNPTRSELLSEIRTLAAQVGSHDDVVFFYAGHGVQIDNVNYLLPRDVPLASSARQIRDESVSLQLVLEDMAASKPRFTLFIIDACRNNPFRGATTTRALLRGETGLASVTTLAMGQMIVFSAGANQLAIDSLSEGDANPNSLFTREFLSGMRQPGIPVDQVLRAIRSRVRQVAASVGHEQLPALYDQSEGAFVFFPGSSAALVPPDATAQPERRPVDHAAGAKAQRAGTHFRDCGDCPQMIWLPVAAMPAVPVGLRDADNPPVSPGFVKRRQIALASSETTIGEFRAFVRETGARIANCRETSSGRKTWDQDLRNPRTARAVRADDFPVACVSIGDARRYAQWLAARTGHRYRLPSFQELEYALSAGIDEPGLVSRGSVCDFGRVSGAGACRDRWVQETGSSGAAPVRSYRANHWGLFDLIGNVSEFVTSCLLPHCAALAWGADFVTDPFDRDGTLSRQIGAPITNAFFGSADNDRADFVGFRVVREDDAD